MKVREEPSGPCGAQATEDSGPSKTAQQKRNYDLCP